MVTDIGTLCHNMGGGQGSDMEGVSALICLCVLIRGSVETCSTAKGCGLSSSRHHGTSAGRGYYSSSSITRMQRADRTIALRNGPCARVCIARASVVPDFKPN